MTIGKVHDAEVMDNLLREDDRAVSADKGYVNEVKKRAARAAGGGEGEAESRTATFNIAEEMQPPSRYDPRQGRARVPPSQMPVGIP